MIVTIFNSKIKHYEPSLFGLIESITLDILDNHEHTNFGSNLNPLYANILTLKKPFGQPVRYQLLTEVM